MENAGEDAQFCWGICEGEETLTTGIKKPKDLLLIWNGSEFNQAFLLWLNLAEYIFVKSPEYREKIERKCSPQRQILLVTSLLFDSMINRDVKYKLNDISKYKKLETKFSFMYLY